MATVQCWTGAQTTALRQAMRLSIRAFAAHLGVDARTVNKWEARGATITLLPDNQALMDTALRRASEEVKTRFTQAADSSTPELRTLAPSAALNDGNESSHPLTELTGLLLAHLAATSAGTTGPTDQETHAHQLADYLVTWAAAVNRRGLLYLLPGIAGGYPLVTRTASETTTPGLDVHPVEHFQQMRKVLVDNDNTFGARTVVLLVQEQINILQRLRQSCQGADRQELLHVQTQFAELCGWLHQDSGDYHAAAYWSGRALEWAHMCG
ncbi:MAG: helix-turn-helix domain-containing protein, partial [Pseudonocardiaceae bacterium]